VPYLKRAREKHASREYLAKRDLLSLRKLRNPGEGGSTPPQAGSQADN